MRCFQILIIASALLCQFSTLAIRRVGPDSRLVLSTVIFRHGDRSPSSTYPNDVHQESAWPKGWKQLTEKGKEQCEMLGQLLRRRYIETNGLVGDKYNSTDVYMRSTDTPRAIASGEAVMLGLYPEDVGPAAVKIQVYKPIEQDLLLKVSTANKENCPAFKAEKSETWAKLEEDFLATQQQLIQFLRDNSGYPSITLDELGTISSASYREQLHNMSQPEWLMRSWTTPSGQQTRVYDELRRIDTASELAETENKKTSKYLAGYLLNEIVKRMTDYRDGKVGQFPEEKAKLLLWSSHSGTLQSLLHNMEVKLTSRIPYATAIMFDLIRVADDREFVVQVSWSTDQINVRNVAVPACDGTNMCALDDFDEELEDRRYDSKFTWTKECNEESDSSKDSGFDSSEEDNSDSDSKSDENRWVGLGK